MDLLVCQCPLLPRTTRLLTHSFQYVPQPVFLYVDLYLSICAGDGHSSLASVDFVCFSDDDLYVVNCKVRCSILCLSG